METVSLVLWVMAVALLIIVYIPKINPAPLCPLAEMFAVAGLVSVFNEYKAGAIVSDVALCLAVAMLTVMTFALSRILNIYMNNVRVKI